MPIIKSARKQLRQNRRRAARNQGTKNMMRNAVKDFVQTADSKKSEAEKKFPHVQKLIDTAAKKRVISNNKASRLVSRLSQHLQQESPKTSK